MTASSSSRRAALLLICRVRPKSSRRGRASGVQRRCKMQHQSRPTVARPAVEAAVSSPSEWLQGRGTSTPEAGS